MSRKASRERTNLIAGLAFLTPNILGFLVFIVFPLFFSLTMAFTNWDLKLHNMFKDEPIRFTFFANFVRLVREPNFWKYLGNTLFFMMGIPLSIAGSLGAALLLSKDVSGGSRRIYRWLLLSATLLVSTTLLALTGLQASAFTILLTGMAGLMLITGIGAGSTVYRTLFFIPHFTSGVAVYILWKKLYNPANGPVNNTLAGPLIALSNLVNRTPPALVRSGLWVVYAAICLIALFGLVRLVRLWRDGALGSVAAVLPLVLLLLPARFSLRWSPLDYLSEALAFLLLCALLAAVVLCVRRGQDFPASLTKGFGDAFMLCFVLMILQFVLIGIGAAVFHLPGWAADGLEPPPWLADYHWAKPAIMIMGLWGSIGSNNMLLYLAGLSNIPSDLYEAADIDGASRFQRFWHVTWPQLAPVTFFIFIMSVIGGLQGGFEMARTMTKGGPFGATTTLSYFIYNEGFSTGRLGYASGIAWTLFAMVFTVTMFNWKFGSRYVND